MSVNEKNSFIFSLSIESNALEKSKNKYFSRFILHKLL